MQREEECYICTYEPRYACRATAPDCKHWCCAVSFLKWIELEQNHTCPVCHIPVTADQLIITSPPELTIEPYRIIDFIVFGGTLLGICLLVYYLMPYLLFIFLHFIAIVGLVGCISLIRERVEIRNSQLGQ